MPHRARSVGPTWGEKPPAVAALAKPLVQAERDRLLARVHAHGFIDDYQGGPIAKVDGLLGQDFFRGRIVQIDFRKKRVRLLDRADAAGSLVLPIRFQNGAMCVPVSVAGSALAGRDWTPEVTVRPSRSGRRGA